jgi:hypothetical protein
MSEVANHVNHEFWRPPSPEAALRHERSKTCDGCGTEFIVGSRFCHACGAGRPELAATPAIQVPGVAEVRAFGKRFGLTTPALAAFLFGVLCMVVALSVGIVFTARTALDWQAIQLWRIEWLLVAIASFGAGLLLKKTA